MKHAIKLIDNEIKHINKFIDKCKTDCLTEDASVTINRNIIKELEITKRILISLYPSVETFFKE